MPQASLDALIFAYREQVDWLLAQAVEFETGVRKVTGQMRSTEIDLSANVAAEYRHKAGNLEAILAAYQRLHDRGL
jgi:hypothetical protein